MGLATSLVYNCKIMFEAKVILPMDKDLCFYFYLLNLLSNVSHNIFNCKPKHALN